MQKLFQLLDFSRALKTQLSFLKLALLIGVFEMLLLNVAKMPNFCNLPGHMNENSHLIGGLLGQVYKYDPF